MTNRKLDGFCYTKGIKRIFDGGKNMKEIIIRVEIYDEDMPISDFEQALLETGIKSIDCSYEIIEN